MTQERQRKENFKLIGAPLENVKLIAYNLLPLSVQKFIFNRISERKHVYMGHDENDKLCYFYLDGDFHNPSRKKAFENMFGKKWSNPSAWWLTEDELDKETK